METERRRQILLGILAVVLAGAAYEAWPRSSTSASAPLTSKQTTVPTPAARGGGGTTGGNPAANAQKNGGGVASGAPDVHLEALSADRPKPAPADRNLFRFKPKAPPAPPPLTPQQQLAIQQQQQMVTPPTPSGPPPLPPITLKCIGIVDQGNGKPKIAVLTDNTGGPPLYAREGEPVAGRYRILKIGVESIEMAYLDGRGRQTIRVSGL